MNMFIKICVGGAVAGLLSAAFSTESQPAASVVTQTTPQKQECAIASNFKGTGAADRQLSAALKQGLGC